MSPSLLCRIGRRAARRLVRPLAVAVLTAGFAAPVCAQPLLGNDCGPAGAPVHPIDQTIDNLTHVFDFSYEDRPCAIPKHKLWFTGEYMATWLSGVNVPPLVTGSANGVPFGTAAVLNQPTTNVLFGGAPISENPYSGARFTVGSWLTEHYHQGLEASGFVLGSRQTAFTASGTGAGDSVAVGRPIIIAQTGNESVAYAAFANQLAGSASVLLNTDLWGVEANGLWRERLIGKTFITFIGGVRYMDLDQQLRVQDRVTPQGNATIPLAGLVGISNPNIARVTDTFQTHNQFIGGQLGFRTNTELGRFDLGVSAKCAFGGTAQTINIDGVSEALATNGQPILASPGGLLATSTNIGRYSRNTFSIVRGAELKLGFRITDYLTAFVAWDYVYWSRIVTPGDQVSRTVDLTRVPTSGVFVFTPGVVGNANITSSNLNMNSITVGACVKY